MLVVDVKEKGSGDEKVLVVMVMMGACVFFSRSTLRCTFLLLRWVRVFFSWSTLRCSPLFMSDHIRFVQDRVSRREYV